MTFSSTATAELLSDWARLHKRLSLLTQDDEAPPMPDELNALWDLYREGRRVPRSTELAALSAWEREATALIMSIL